MRPSSTTVADLIVSYLYREGNLKWGPFWPLIEHNFDIGYTGDINSAREAACRHSDTVAVEICDLLLNMKRTAREKCGHKVGVLVDAKRSAGLPVPPPAKAVPSEPQIDASSVYKISAIRTRMYFTPPTMLGRRSRVCSCGVSFCSYLHGEPRLTAMDALVECDL